jgi:hypothetical protein
MNASWYVRPFICLDGAHMKTEKVLCLFIVTILDANEDLMPLMCGLAKPESLESCVTLAGGRLRLITIYCDVEK